MTATEQDQAQDQKTTQTLERGLDLLHAFTAAKPVLTIEQLAKATELPVSTVYRLVRTLLKSGFVEKATNSHYRLGVQWLVRGSVARAGWLQQLDEQGEQLLFELAQTTVTTAVLLIPTSEVGVDSAVEVLRVDANGIRRIADVVLYHPLRGTLIDAGVIMPSEASQYAVRAAWDKDNKPLAYLALDYGCGSIPNVAAHSQALRFAAGRLEALLRVRRARSSRAVDADTTTILA